ncbi:MAG: hypothetical protein AABX69_01580 [Nanoarchaeota archaeon]
MAKMSLEDAAALFGAEERYERMQTFRWANRALQLGSPTPYSQVTEKFSILHGPYVSLADTAGRILLMSVLDRASWPNWLKEEYPQQGTERLSYLMLEAGGTVRFDAQCELNYIPDVVKLVPENYDGKLDPEALENRMVEQVSSSIVIVLEALRLPDGSPSVGLDHEELRKLARNLQSYTIAKTFGLAALKSCSDNLRRGEILDSPTLDLYALSQRK